MRIDFSGVPSCVVELFVDTLRPVMLPGNVFTPLQPRKKTIVSKKLRHSVLI